MSRSRVAVLGAGIMGCSTAIVLARMGFQVVLFDRASQPFSGASRWNEGKIHLGYLYSADPSLDTAKHVLPGSMAFRKCVEDQLGCSIAPAITAKDDTYLCHRSSVVTADRMWERMQELDEHINQLPQRNGYLNDSDHFQCRRLSQPELDHCSGSEDILAGFRVPERSVSTTWIADKYLQTIEGQSNIAFQPSFEIKTVTSNQSDRRGDWTIHGDEASQDGFKYVINCLWEGRLAVEQSMQLPLPKRWSHRYRRALFVQTSKTVKTPSVIVSTGPFGDIKNYDDRNFYLSWYPAGLAVNSESVLPPDPAELDDHQQQELIETVFDQLSQYVPATRDIQNHASTISVNGGWVFASANGELSDPSATLHRRTEFGFSRLGNYISVDTGKYCTAPWMASRLASFLTA